MQPAVFWDLKDSHHFSDPHWTCERVSARKYKIEAALSDNYVSYKEDEKKGI
jgi:hypothetical protein